MIESRLEGIAVEFALLGISGFSPLYGESRNYKAWTAHPTPGTCAPCLDSHGKIFSAAEKVEPEPPVHPNCHCTIEKMLAILAGTATIDGKDGADYTMRYFASLPKTYCTKKFANQHGWKRLRGNLRVVLPNATIGGDVFRNGEDKLPAKPGRVWREADINYTGGIRNGHRILYSNDGLIFATYDHYLTFHEIV